MCHGPSEYVYCTTFRSQNVEQLRENGWLQSITVNQGAMCDDKRLEK
jgi:hypothetical protein